MAQACTTQAAPQATAQPGQGMIERHRHIGQHPARWDACIYPAQWGSIPALLLWWETFISRPPAPAQPSPAQQ